MIQMRPEQQAAFSAEAQHGFEARAAAFLRDEFPEKWGTTPDPELAAFVRDSQRRAKPYGLTTEQAVVSVACIRCFVGDDWSAEPWDWIPKMLGDTKYDPNFRAKMAAQLADELSRPQPPKGG